MKSIIRLSAFALILGAIAIFTAPKTVYSQSGFEVQTGTNGTVGNAGDYDQNGYDKDGYDRSGFDHNGYDRDGYYTDGYNKDGYNRKGDYMSQQDRDAKANNGIKNNGSNSSTDGGNANTNTQSNGNGNTTTVPPKDK